MSKDILGHLPLPCSEFPRQFADADLDLNSWADLEPLFKDLSDRNVDSSQNLKIWIENWSEMESILKEQESRLYINMTCDTQDEKHEKAFAHYVAEIEPKLAPIIDGLNKKLISSPAIGELDSYYDHWIQDIRAQLELYREENIEIETKIALTSQEYQKVTGSMTVEWQGETTTLQVVNAELENPDRTLREKAWKTVWTRRFEDKDILNTHFKTLFDFRQNVSKNCGFDSYLPYIFKAKGRYDYTPKHCEDFHDAIEKCVVPLNRKLLKARAKTMGLEKLRPWDLAVDPLGRPALKPFENIEKLCEGTSKIFHGISSDFGDKFDTMQKMGLLDLDSRLGKAPGGYQCGLEEYRLPFIFMNAVGTNSDLFTLLHEGGHSLHQFFMKGIHHTSYREIMAEIAEVASMSMELVGLDYIENIYPNPDDALRAKADQFEDVIHILPWVAIVDAFQHWMYKHPDHSEAERNEKWLELDRRFGAGDIVDWSGFEEYQAHQWQRQLHLFEVPFYYIEYGIAQLGAIGVFKNIRENKEQGIKMYTEGLSLGGSQGLPSLFEKTGIPFDFSIKTVEPLIKFVQDEIEKLETK